MSWGAKRRRNDTFGYLSTILGGSGEGGSDVDAELNQLKGQPEDVCASSSTVVGEEGNEVRFDAI